MSNEVKAKLREAGEYMSEHGHAKGEHIDGTGRVCMLGAIGRVTGALTLMGEDDNGAPVYEWVGTPLAAKAQKALQQHLNEGKENEDMRLIADWNDNVLSAEDCILALKRAGEED